MSLPFRRRIDSPRVRAIRITRVAIGGCTGKNNHGGRYGDPEVGQRKEGPI